MKSKSIKGKDEAYCSNAKSSKNKSKEYTIDELIELGIKENKLQLRTFEKNSVNISIVK